MTASSKRERKKDDSESEQLARLCPLYEAALYIIRDYEIHAVHQYILSLRVVLRESGPGIFKKWAL